MSAEGIVGHRAGPKLQLFVLCDGCVHLKFKARRDGDLDARCGHQGLEGTLVVSYTPSWLAGDPVRIVVTPHWCPLREVTPLEDELRSKLPAELAEPALTPEPPEVYTTQESDEHGSYTMLRYRDDDTIVACNGVTAGTFALVNGLYAEALGWEKAGSRWLATVLFADYMASDSVGAHTLVAVENQPLADEAREHNRLVEAAK